MFGPILAIDYLAQFSLFCTSVGTWPAFWLFGLIWIFGLILIICLVVPWPDFGYFGCLTRFALICLFALSRKLKKGS